jgi:hypothetical protein
MGGRKSSSSSSSNRSSETQAPQVTQPDPIIEYLKQMQKQQDKQAADAAAAQKQALINSQVASGQQAKIQGQQAAMQDLATQGSMQSIRDSNALAAMQQAQSTAGQQATGGGFDINTNQQDALSNLYGAKSILPMTQSNMQYGVPNLANQGVGGMTQKTNTFSLPKSSDLQFGGA